MVPSTEAAAGVAAPADGTTRSGRSVLVEEQILLGISSRAEALSALQRALRTRLGVDIRHAGADELVVISTYRPAWARLAAIVLALPTAGLALLFLLVRRRDTARFRLRQDQDGLRLVVSGCMEEPLLPVIRSLGGPDAGAPVAGTLSARTPFSPAELFAPAPGTATGPVTAGPVTSGPVTTGPVESGAVTSGAVLLPVETDHTVRRPSSLPKLIPDVPADGADQGYLLELDSGERVPVGELVLIGRDPARGEDEQHARLVPVDDPDRSVSKTHLSVSASPGGVWVTDRHSTNGVEVIEDGVARRLPPGTGVLVPRGAQVRFGDRRLYVT